MYQLEWIKAQNKTYATRIHEKTIHEKVPKILNLTYETVIRNHRKQKMLCNSWMGQDFSKVELNTSKTFYGSGNRILNNSESCKCLKKIWFELTKIILIISTWNVFVNRNFNKYPTHTTRNWKLCYSSFTFQNILPFINFDTYFLYLPISFPSRLAGSIVRKL